MSANGDVLRRSELIESREQETALPQVEVFHQTNDWNPEDFAREQIRGLVRRVFLTGSGRPMKQVVFSAAEPHTDVANICDQVGRALALETRADIAIIGRGQRERETSQIHALPVESAALKSQAVRIVMNLWYVPELGLQEHPEAAGAGPCWLSCLAKLRNEFEYAVIQGPVAGISSEAALLGRLADGIILVLEAHSTRKAAARKIKETLEGGQCRILGTVLSERKFPLPERIYRRL
jgi:hypothetical protein